jgi:glycosyltransferase involved in cell wall biosynthesis
MHVHKAYVQLSVSPVVEASRHGVPVVQTVHDYEFVSASPFDSSGSWWDTNESRFSFQALNSATFLARYAVHRPRVDRWIAVSDSVARRYRDERGIECTVIPNFTSPSGKPVVPHSKRDGILFLGRLSQEKGIEDLLKVAKLDPDTKFIFAGDGPLRDRVVEAAKTFPNIDYRGFVNKSEGSELIRSAVACAMPSLWEEPGPLVSLEAMAEGTPVICYPKGGLAEYVSDSEAGIVCRRADCGEISSAVRTLGTDSVSWAKYSQNGLRAIVGRHSREKYLDSLERVYDSAIDSQP